MLNLFILLLLIFLLVSTTKGLHAKQEKHVSDWLIVSRCCFFLLLTCQIVQFFLSWQTRLLTSLIWLLFSLILFVFTANAFREKMVTFGNPRHARLVFWGLVIDICLTLIIIFF